MMEENEAAPIAEEVTRQIELFYEMYPNVVLPRLGRRILHLRVGGDHFETRILRAFFLKKIPDFF